MIDGKIDTTFNLCYYLRHFVYVWDHQAPTCNKHMHKIFQWQNKMEKMHHDTVRDAPLSFTLAWKLGNLLVFPYIYEILPPAFKKQFKGRLTKKLWEKHLQSEEIKQSAVTSTPEIKMSSLKTLLMMKLHLLLRVWRTNTDWHGNMVRNDLLKITWHPFTKGNVYFVAKMTAATGLAETK